MCELKGAPDWRQKHVWAKRQAGWGRGLRCCCSEWSQSSSPVVEGALLCPSAPTTGASVEPSPTLRFKPSAAATQPLSWHCEQTRKRLLKFSIGSKFSSSHSQQVGRQFLCNFKREWNVSKDWHCLHDPYMLKSYKSAGMGWDWMYWIVC